jgi:hypothetical protein
MSERKVININREQTLLEFYYLNKCSNDKKGLYFIGILNKKIIDIVYIGATLRSFKIRAKEHYDGFIDNQNKFYDDWRNVLGAVDVNTLIIIPLNIKYPFLFEQLLLQSFNFYTALNKEYLGSEGMLDIIHLPKINIEEIKFNKIIEFIKEYDERILSSLKNFNDELNKYFN